MTNPNLCVDGADFTKEQCQDVQRELSNELKWRETVYRRFRALERPIDKTQGAVSDNASWTPITGSTRT